MLLQHYENVLSIVTRMLDQARNDEWGNVTALSKDYIEAVKEIQALPPSSSSEAETVATQTLLAKITQKDAEIRKLAQPELHRLGALLGDTKRHKEVVQAYRAPSSNA